MRAQREHLDVAKFPCGTRAALTTFRNLRNGDVAWNFFQKETYERNHFEFSPIVS